MHEGLVYYVYLLASRKHGTLYLGMTNDLLWRAYEHRAKLVEGLTAKYGVTRLVWYEAHHHPTATIAREKQIKKWRRDWKIALIEEQNPEWHDLFETVAV
jgi:putative endonuclease